MAFDVFCDKKPWEPAAVWGDHSYLSSELNPSRDMFQQSFAKLVDGSKKTYFSDLVDKMNPNGKMVERAILLTDKGFYRMTPGKYNVDKHNALSDIKAISMTTKSDNLVILHHESSRDSVINLTFYIGSGAKKELRRTRSFSNIGGKVNSVLLENNRKSVGANDNNAAADPMIGTEAKGDDESERHSEFVSQIISACRDAGVPEPEVKFSDSIEVNVSKKQGAKQIVVLSSVPNQDVPNSSWIMGKNAHQVTTK